MSAAGAGGAVLVAWKKSSGVAAREVGDDGSVAPGAVVVGVEPGSSYFDGSFDIAPGPGGSWRLAYDRFQADGVQEVRSFVRAVS